MSDKRPLGPLVLVKELYSSDTEMAFKKNFDSQNDLIRLSILDLTYIKTIEIIFDCTHPFFENTRSRLSTCEQPL